MKNLKVARRYAMALLLIGKEDGQTEVYREELASFAALLSENAELHSAINNPIYESASRKKVLDGLLSRMGAAPAMKAFLLLVFDKGRMRIIDSIEDEFQKLADEYKGIARASLATADDLSEEAVAKIKEGLAKMTGKEVVLGVKKDPALIGGLVTRIGDLVLDGSVRTQLVNLKESLKRSEAV